MAIEAIQGKVRSEPLNRNFSYVETKSHDAKETSEMLESELRNDLEAHISDTVNPHDMQNKLDNLENVIDDKLDRKVNRAEIEETVVVGPGRDFPTINEAIEYLSNKRPEHISGSDYVKAEIRLASDYLMEEQVFVHNTDLSWIILTTSRPSVTIVRSALTRSIDVNITPEFKINPAFACFDGSLPIIDVLFIMDETGSGNTHSGIFLDNSRVKVMPNKGVRNATFIGLCAINGSNAVANHSVFSEAGNRDEIDEEDVEQGLYWGDGFRIWSSTLSASYAIADECGDLGFNISQGSKAIINGARSNNCGHHGLLVTSASICAAREAEFKDTLDDCVVAYAGGAIDLRGSDCSNSSINFGLIATRSAYINFENGTANYCGASGIAANRGSVVDATGATANFNRGHNVYAHNASVIVFSEGEAREAGVDNIHANHGSVINARLATLTGAGRNAVLAFGGASISVDGANLSDAIYRGIEATHSSLVNAQNVDASNAGDRGVLAYANSFIDLNGADVSGASVRCIEATRASVINAQGVDASGAGDKGVIAFGASTINLDGSNVRNAGGNGVECSRGSRINAQGVDASGAGDTGFVCYNGSIINAVNTIGTFNKTPNEVTRHGIIFSDREVEEDE